MSPRSPGSCRGEWYTEATLRVQSARMAMGGPRLPGPPRTRSRRRGQERTEFRTTRMHLRTLDGRHSTHAYTHTFLSPLSTAMRAHWDLRSQSKPQAPVLFSLHRRRSLLRCESLGFSVLNVSVRSALFHVTNLPLLPPPHTQRCPVGSAALPLATLHTVWALTPR